MTYEEAKDILTHTTIQFGRLQGKTLFVKALMKAVEAIDKQILQKPLPVRDLRSCRIISFRCPNCQSDFLGQNEYRLDRCEYCGQALDWSETK